MFVMEHFKNEEDNMRKLKLMTLLLVLMALMLPPSVFARDIEPIVSTDWLEKNLSNPKLIVVDIRKPEEYKAGHIPGAINVFYNSWAVKKGALNNQLPSDDDLKDLLSASGIQPDSLVVVAGLTETGPDRVNSTRVGWTLKYAGVENVGILDGGHNKWINREKKALSTDVVRPKAKPYRGKFNKDVLATKDYVTAQMGKAVIVDSREPDFFMGKQKLPFVEKAGRIPGAVNLPTAQVFEKYPPGDHLEMCCNTFKDKNALANMAGGVVGNDKSKEIIVYCDTGRVASAWWWLLHEVLEYKNVKNFDGSMQEWAMDPKAPVQP